MKDLYFISEEARIIFGLVELEGKIQLAFLGVDLGHYQDKNTAKSWYKFMKEKIENSEHPMKDLAIEKLEKLYKGMGGKI